MEASNADDREQTNVSKVISVVVKLAAVLFIVIVPATYAIEFQLAGGVWILQTFPAVFLALFVPWFNRWAVIAGWAAGIGAGTWMLIQEKFATSVHILSFLPDLAGPSTSGSLHSF